MTAQFLTLEIGALVIPDSAMGRLRVDYEDLEARTDRRVADGTFNSRVGWAGARKLLATIAGDSWAPPGLDDLDIDSSYTVKLPKQRSKSSASNIITIPAARRSGGLYDPVGFAVVDGGLVETTVDDVTGDVYTLGTVAGASGYRVEYFPQITAKVRPQPSTLDSERRSHGWQILVQEV